MYYQFPPDLEKLVSYEMSAGGYASHDELLGDALRALRDRPDDLASIQAGIADMKAGRLRPFVEVAEEIRNRHGFAGT